MMDYLKVKKEVVEHTFGHQEYSSQYKTDEERSRFLNSLNNVAHREPFFLILTPTLKFYLEKTVTNIKLQSNLATVKEKADQIINRMNHYSVLDHKNIKYRDDYYQFISCVHNNYHELTPGEQLNAVVDDYDNMKALLAGQYSNLKMDSFLSTIKFTVSCFKEAYIENPTLLVDAQTVVESFLNSTTFGQNNNRRSDRERRNRAKRMLKTLDNIKTSN